MDSTLKSVYSRPALGIKGQRPMGLGGPEDKSFPEGPQSWEGQSLGKDAGGGGRGRIYGISPPAGNKGRFLRPA